MESVLNQTYKNIEIILVNDGSSPECVGFLDEYRKNSRVIVLDKENGGVSSARNLGLKQATGEYVLFVDPDDWMSETACEKFIVATEQYPDVDYIFSKINICEGQTQKQNYSSHPSGMVENKQELFDAIFLNSGNRYTCVDTVWAKLYKTDFLRKNKIVFNERLLNSEDCMFNFECIFNAKNILFLSEPLYFYRVNETSACRVCSDLDVKSIKTIEEFKKYFDLYNAWNEAKHFDNYVIRVICRLLRKYYIKCKTFREFKEEFKNILDNKAFSESISRVNSKQLTKGKRFVLSQCKKKRFIVLYLLIKFNIQIR